MNVMSISAQELSSSWASVAKRHGEVLENYLLYVFKSSRERQGIKDTKTASV
jgi:hypothetical protein